MSMEPDALHPAFFGTATSCILIMVLCTCMSVPSSHHNELVDLLLAVKSRKEMQDLLEDLLTPQELESLTERWQIVQLLLQGKTQRKVAKILGISVAKATRGSRVIQYGKGAFEKFAKRLKR